MIRYYLNQVRSADLSQVNDLLKNNLYLILVLVIYLIIGIILLPHYQYVINADGFSYVTIAQKYAHGDFNNAINGLWSPLISWLLSILLIFNSSPEYAVYAFKILLLMLGLFPLVGIYLLSLRFEIDKKIRMLLLIFSIPAILFIALVKTTPDLLLLGFILLYLYIIFNSKYSDNILNVILCGILGSLAYFTKSYIFVFFPVHFISLNLYNYFKINKNRKKLVKTLFIGLTTFFIISSFWVGIISDKYDFLTMGTAAEYNHNLMGPNPYWHPMTYQGLFKPPNKTALSAWEDPTYHKTESWDPLSSWKLFKYQLEVILNNIFPFIWMLTISSALSVFILIFSIILCIKKPKNVASNQIIIYSLLTIFIYSAGFFTVFFEFRYILIDYILVFLLGGHLLTILYKNNFKRNPVINLLVIILMISFIINPVISLNAGFNKNTDLYNLSQSLKNDYNIKGNIASTQGFISFEESHFISYYLNSQYYGGINGTDANFEKELKENDIDYYLAWDYYNIDGIELPFKEIRNGNVTFLKDTKYLKVYSIKT